MSETLRIPDLRGMKEYISVFADDDWFDRSPPSSSHGTFRDSNPATYPHWHWTKWVREFQRTGDPADLEKMEEFVSETIPPGAPELVSERSAARQSVIVALWLGGASFTLAGLVLATVANIPGMVLTGIGVIGLIVAWILKEKSCS